MDAGVEIIVKNVVNNKEENSCNDLNFSHITPDFSWEHLR